jgi:hypothetical protein
MHAPQLLNHRLVVLVNKSSEVTSEKLGDLALLAEAEGDKTKRHDPGIRGGTKKSTVHAGESIKDRWIKSKLGKKFHSPEGDGMEEDNSGKSQHRLLEFAIQLGTARFRTAVVVLQASSEGLEAVPEKHNHVQQNARIPIAVSMRTGSDR